MKLIKDKTIAIVGGGPGGLTLARLLQINGADVNVYERDLNKDVRVQGATLDLHENSGLKALRKAGLMDKFKENYRPDADKMRITDSNAIIYYDHHNEDDNRDFGHSYYRPEIDRGPLRNILLESLETGTVVWNSHLHSIKQDDSKWKLEFKNGTSATANIVIGADGANSKVRPFITPIRAFYTGITGIEGNVYDTSIATPNVHALLKGGKIFAFGHSNSLITSSKGDGSLSFYISFRTHENWVRECGTDFQNKEQVFAWFKKDFPEWSGVWYELFEQAEMPFVARPIYCMPLDQTWKPLANLTMLGDAAHLMPPFAGEGVNMAMLDALELSECLCSDQFQDIIPAIAAYETQMRNRGAEAAKRSLENTEWMHSEKAIDTMLELFDHLKSVMSANLES